MHEKRGEYVKRVRNVVAEDLLQNGLELGDGVAHPARSDGHGVLQPVQRLRRRGVLTRLTEQIERRKKIRNDIEQDTMIEIRNKNLDTERQGLEIDRACWSMRGWQQEQDLETQQCRPARERGARACGQGSGGGAGADHGTRRPSNRPPYRLGAGASRSSASPRNARSRNSGSHAASRSSFAEQERNVAIAEQSKAQSEGAKTAADRARAIAVTEEERVFTARDRDGATAQEHRADRGSGKRQSAKPCGSRSPRRPSGTRPRIAVPRCAPEAEADADAEEIRALASRIRFEVDAEGTRLVNEAQNPFGPVARLSAMRMRLIESSMPSFAGR